MKNTYILLAFCLSAIFVKQTLGEPVVISGDSSDIEVRRMLSGKLVKTFKAKGYGKLCVAAFYEEDMLFYAAYGKIYKIALLDENGQPTISKIGKLLTDPSADHQETKLFEMRSDYIQGMVVDKTRRKVVFSDFTDICEINFDGSGFRKLVKGKRSFSLDILGDQLFFSDRVGPGSYTIYRTTITLTNKTISCEQKGGPCKKIVSEGKDFVTSMMVERNSKKLYFRRGSGSDFIAVVDTNLPDSAYPVQTPRVVISDSQYVNGYGGIAVHGNRLVWNRGGSSWGRLLLGLMNNNLNFVSKKHIYNFGDESYGNVPRQLDVFEHMFPTQAPTNPKPTTQGQCQCPCKCPT